jgi:4'-phosphopantetheinyl transferase EntD
MFSTQVSQKFKVGQCVHIFSAKDCHGKAKYPAWEQYVDLEGIIIDFYHARYGPLFVDGVIGWDDIYFYNIVFDGNFTVGVPEDMLEVA